MMATEIKGEILEERTLRRGLAVVLGFATILPILFYLGPRYGDHFLYIRHAADIVSGDYRPSADRWGMRLGLLLPLALLQALTRSWSVSAALLTLAASWAHILGVYALGRSFGGSRLGLWAAAIVAVLPLETLNGTMPFPDLMTAALGAWALTLVHRESVGPSPRPGLLLAAGALLGWGYLAKQTAVFYLLAIGAWALAFRRWRWAWVAVPFAVTLAIEMAILAIFTGNPFARTADAGADAHIVVSQWYGGNQGRVARILWHIPSLLFNPIAKDFPYLMGLAWIFAAATPRLFRTSGGKELFAGTGLLLLQIWFWPSSLSPFVPALIAEGRHVFPLCAPLALGAGTLLLNVRPGRRLLLFGLWTAACLVGTTGIYLYLSREDAGLREAYRVLRDRGAGPVRALDAWGNCPALLDYLDGPRGKMSFTGYKAEDVWTIRREHVVVDDRTRVFRNSGGPFMIGRDLPIPDSWTLVWEKTYSTRWDPRHLILGRPTGKGEHRFRIYYAP